MVNSIVPKFQVGSNIFQGGGGEGHYLFLWEPIEIVIFERGSPTLHLNPHMALVVSINYAA